jgi:hypothetical protein
MAAADIFFIDFFSKMFELVVGCSKFYLQYGVLDIFIELFSNPNVR